MFLEILAPIQKMKLVSYEEKTPAYYFCSNVVTLNQTHNAESQYNIQA